MNRPHNVEHQARQRLERNCQFGYYFRNVECCFEDGVLHLRGRVPTFYMKQVLQTLLRGIDEVEQIDNRVEVVSSSGLSTVPKA